MNNKLFVGGLAWKTDEASLRAFFEQNGKYKVIEAKVVLERETGRSRGFGFVTFETEEDASAAMAELDGQELDGRAIRISVAEDKKNDRN